MTNCLLLVYGNKAKSRNGDVYLITKSGRKYVDSAKILGNMVFDGTGMHLQNKDYTMKFVSEILLEEKYDDIESYLPFLKNDRIIIPRPYGEEKAEIFNFRFNDCTITTSSVFPEITNLENGVTVTSTLLCDRNEPETTFKLCSYWTSFEGKVRAFHIHFKTD